MTIFGSEPSLVIKACSSPKNCQFQCVSGQKDIKKTSKNIIEVNNEMNNIKKYQKLQIFIVSVPLAQYRSVIAHRFRVDLGFK